MATVLVVDDSAIVRKVARRMLEAMGLSVTEAENGQLALECCRKAIPDGVLLDWNMPVMDGITFLERLRALEDCVQPRVIFCTSESDLERIVEAMKGGADEYIMKPFDEEILASKLAMVGLLSEAAVQ